MRVQPSRHDREPNGPRGAGRARRGVSLNSAEQALRVSEERFRELCASAPVGVALCDLEGRFIEINAALASTLDRGTTELVGKSIHDLFHPDDAEYLTRAYAELAEAGGQRRLRERRRLIKASGEQTWVNLSVSVLRDVDGTASFLTVVQDVSELHLLQQRFQYQGLHDALTGLPNRQFFVTRLEAALSNLPGDAELALYHLALDGFEVINEGLGYQVGDELVKSAARRIENLVEGEEAMAARFGGIEFGILLRQTPDVPGVAEFAARINDELAEPIYFDDYGVATSASIGVVCRCVAEGSTQSMMRAAEVAMRRATANGKRQWALFDRDKDSHDRVEARLAAMIPGALEMGEFSLVYRPIADLIEDRTVGVQANLCWEPAGHDRLGHPRCLELAERTGVTLCLRAWLVGRVWEQVACWRREGSWPSVQIDFSPNQSTDPDLVASMRRVLDDQPAEGGLGTRGGAEDLGWLWLSFPMDVIMGESEEARDNIDILGSMGLRTAVHDFRGSPEELRRLRGLPVQAVRLAPELVHLVHEAPEEPEARAVVGMLPLIRAGDRLVVVDGITTAEQARLWRSLGCKIAAGSYYGEPVSGQDVPELLLRS